MKLLKVSAILICGALLIAATKGTQVTQSQIEQFKKGVATILDNRGKAGHATKDQAVG